MKAWLNGTFIDAEDAKVPLLAHSFSRGSAIFEVLDIAETAAGPALFRLDAHVERLFGSAGFLKMKLPFTRDEISDAVVETARETGVRAGAVKFFAYYSAPAFALVPDDPEVSVAIFCLERTMTAKKTITAGISTIRKLSPRAIPVHAKACGHYVGPFLAKLEVAERGCDEPILLDDGGHVAEGALCNIFFVTGAGVRTPLLRNALPGITRDSVIEVIRGLGIELEEADITPDEVSGCDEVFFTGSTIRVLPVSSVDGRPVGGDGAECPGPVTARILAGLNDAYEGRDERYAKWLTRVE